MSFEVIVFAAAEGIMSFEVVFFAAAEGIKAEGSLVSSSVNSSS